MMRDSSGSIQWRRHGNMLRNKGAIWYRFVVSVDSGMGTIPVAMSRECFDLGELAVGKVLEMRADIKADFSTYRPEEESE